MIESKELRIGNLVRDTAGNVNTVTVATFNYVCNEPHHQVKPIPLTEEWLLKFGFEIIDTYFNEGLTVNTYGINITDCNNDEKLICCDWDMTFSIGDYNEDDCYVMNNDIQYVHQLQNLYFALTGEELKIK